MHAASANNPTKSEYRVFFILMLEKYKAIIYIVVSVLPVIIEAILPIIESGPYVLNILFKSINEDEDETGRSNAKGRISLGIIFIFIKDTISFKRLLFINTVTDNIIANIEGKIDNDISNPSLTPFINSLYISTFFIIAYTNTSNVIIGII